MGKGLRASLKTGSLITGALYVDLDYYEDAAARGDWGMRGSYTTIPTVSSGFAQLEAKLTAILDKIQALPHRQDDGRISPAAAEEAKTTIAESRTTLKEIEATAAAARKTLEDPEFRELARRPAQDARRIAEIRGQRRPGRCRAGRSAAHARRTARRACARSRRMTTTIDEKPNSLLFGRESSGNPTPKAPRAER